MFKIKNIATDEHKRVRLIPKEGAEVNSLDENIVEQGNGDLTFCLAPDTSSGPSDILGIALGLGNSYSGGSLRMGAILVKKEWNPEGKDFLVMIGNKPDPEQWIQGHVSPFTDIPDSDQKIIVFDTNDGESPTGEIETWQVALIIPEDKLVIISEWTGIWEATLKPRSIVVYEENEVDVKETYLSFQVTENHLLPEAVYGDGYYMPQYERETIMVLPSASEELLPRLSKTYDPEAGDYGSISVMGRIWGDRRDGEVWETNYGFSAAVFGKVNGVHTGIFQGLYVW